MMSANTSNEPSNRYDPSAPQEQAALGRLTRAETTGLRLAILCRTLAMAAALIWYVGIALVAEGFDLRIDVGVALAFFTGLGVAHLTVIGTRLDRWWLKYVIYTFDVAGICALFVLIPISPSGDVPQIIAFRAYGIYYLFPIVAMACLSLSWRLVIWVGVMVAAGWWSAFLWIVSGMTKVYSWGDFPANPTRKDYEEIFLSLEFIGRGNRVEETGLLLVAALILALAVYRARRVFFAQIEAEREQVKERRGPRICDGYAWPFHSGRSRAYFDRGSLAP